MRVKNARAVSLAFVLAFVVFAAPVFPAVQSRGGSRETPVIEKIVKFVKRLILKPNDDLALPKP